MIIYHNKQDKSGENKIIQKQNDFAAENFKVRNWVVIYQKNKFNYWEIRASEAIGEMFFMILLHKWHFKWES